MSTLTSLARALAFETGRAVPVAARRHAHLSDRPLVFVPLSLAGEANAPLACLVGSQASAPRLLVVPQPRNRDLRFAFAASLASVVLDYVDSFAASMEVIEGRNVATDAPQLLVANPSGVAFTRLLGRSTRLRRTEGEYAVEPSVPLLGLWLTYFAERNEHPGSSSMLAMTSVLAAHWATGQSTLEDANLAALIGWIDPPPGMSGPEAAAMAEDPVRCPPAGPATDPTFDNEVLAPLVRSYDHAVDDAGRARAAAALGTALRGRGAGDGPARAAGTDVAADVAWGLVAPGPASGSFVAEAMAAGPSRVHRPDGVLARRRPATGANGPSGGGGPPAQPPGTRTGRSHCGPGVRRRAGHGGGPARR